MTATRLFLGGTFDPVHTGHMRLALECQAQLQAELYFVPCKAPVHKAEPQIATEHRLRMLELAVEELNRVSYSTSFALEPCELSRAQPSYSTATLAYLRTLYPHDTLVWIIGMDSWLGLNQWHQWQNLTEHANLLVVNRPGFEAGQGLAPEQAQWLEGKVTTVDALPKAGAVCFVQTSPMAVASSHLRNLVSRGQSSAFLVCEPVRHYMQTHQLYR